MFRGKSLIFLFQTAVSSAADHKRRQNELRTSLRHTVTQFSLARRQLRDFRLSFLFKPESSLPAN